MKKSFVKAVSVVISAVLAVGVMSVASFAEKVEMKFTVATDTHYQGKADLGTMEEAYKDTSYSEGMLDRELYFHTTIQGQMNFESEAIVRSMLDSFVASDSEFLLIGGDLTCGKRQSHKEFAELLREAEQKSGKPIFVTVGNHDCDDSDFDKYIDIEEFKSIYADFGFNEAIASDPASASYVAELPGRYRLLAVDSCIYGADDGEISDETMSWIEEQAEDAFLNGKKLIAMMHHSILSHFGVQPMMDNSEAIAQKFAELGIKFVFTGHIHANDISMAKSGGKTVYDIQTGALITSPNAYRTVTFSGNKVDIKSEYVTSVDTSYLPEGFTPDQLSMIKTDFASYSANYFEAGICKWLNRYVGSAGKVGKMLKFDPESVEYKAIDAIMLNIGEALDLPIYDDGATPDVVDSIEEIAAISGVELPESDYERIYQVAAKVMGSFYHGDESQSLQTEEFPLIYSCLKAVLARTASNMVFGGDSALLDSVTKEYFGFSIYNDSLAALSGFNYSEGIADMMLGSVIYTLCDGLINDYSEPEDINVVLPGYGADQEAENTVSLSLIMKIFDFIVRFFKSLFAFAA